MSCWRADGEALLLSVRLTPRSAREGVGGVWTDEKGALWLKAQVRAVPEKGRANDALIALLAKTLGVPPRAISLAAGDSNRLKRLRIMGPCTALAETIETLAGLQ
ncbi:DUF167 family protein [Sphingobium aquiterrae]|uniref:DUF167 family protein n=1 Tax=Sphingobium aquiterrae TaxID=2038656 RepID=UPI003019718E